MNNALDAIWTFSCLKFKHLRSTSIVHMSIEVLDLDFAEQTSTEVNAKSRSLYYFCSEFIVLVEYRPLHFSARRSEHIISQENKVLFVNGIFIFQNHHRHYVQSLKMFSLHFSLHFVCNS